MSNHQQEDSIQYLYEGDQSKLYSGVILAHSSDVSAPESRAKVKRIWKVFFILLIITVAEVTLGMFFHHSMPKALLATLFLLMTVAKAGYIVSVFMHLGDERKTFFWSILMPLILFVWFIIAFLLDGKFWLHMNTVERAGMQQVESTK